MGGAKGVVHVDVGELGEVRGREGGGGGVRGVEGSKPSARARQPAGARLCVCCPRQQPPPPPAARSSSERAAQRTAAAPPTPPHPPTPITPWPAPWQRWGRSSPPEGRSARSPAAAPGGLEEGMVCVCGSGGGRVMGAVAAADPAQRHAGPRSHAPTHPVRRARTPCPLPPYLPHTPLPPPTPPPHLPVLQVLHLGLHLGANAVVSLEHGGAHQLLQARAHRVEAELVLGAALGAAQVGGQ